MAERTQKSKGTTSRDAETSHEAAPAVTETGEKLKAELDDLLDEIDEVLETNAEDFVKSYVQKGGQ
jgi:prokaryotic ubiquitin-like protein Pup